MLVSGTMRVCSEPRSCPDNVPIVRG